MRTRRIDVPDDLAGADTLDDPTYSYACELTVGPGDARDAEAWMRATMEGAPRWFRAFLVIGWRYGLLLRIGSTEPAPERVIGWPIDFRSPSTIALVAGSPLLEAHLLLSVQGDRVVHATRLRYRNRTARVLWTLARPVHQLTIPHLLRRAARHQARQ